MRSNSRTHQIGLRTLLAAIALLSIWFSWAEVVVQEIDESKRLAAEREAAVRLRKAPLPTVVFSAH